MRDSVADAYHNIECAQAGDELGGTVVSCKTTGKVEGGAEKQRFGGSEKKAHPSAIAVSIIAGQTVAQVLDDLAKRVADKHTGGLVSRVDEAL